MRSLALLCLLVALAGCAGPAPTGTAPDLEPPPASSEPPLSRAEVLEVVKGSPDNEQAIRTLDARRFAFALDAATVEWFRDQGVPTEIADYLEKRARVDWDGLRGDIDPSSPEHGEYVDPRRGFDDFAGVQRYWSP
jgi:hypothetical protein